MHLILEALSEPPEKKMWHSKNPSDRNEWNKIFEAITNWFCRSNGIRKDHNLVINVLKLQIIFKGEELKYLGPNLRSAASLISKAYNIGQKLRNNNIKEATPGIYVANNQTENYPLPYFNLSLNQKENYSDIPKNGTIFTFPYPNSKDLIVPASNLNQALVWLHNGDMINEL